jgi:hypothetical protein
MENKLKKAYFLIFFLFFPWRSFCQDTCSNSNTVYDPNIVGIIAVKGWANISGKKYPIEIKIKE